MPSNLPTVSVVIPARNAAESVPRALQSVRRQDYPNILEVILAAGDEETAAAAEEGVIVVANPDGDTPSALNRAIAASRGEVIVRCDAQTVLPEDYVSTAITTMMRTGADVVGGMQVPTGENPFERAVAAAMSSPIGAGDARYRLGGEEGPVETVYLGVYRRDVLERVGGFDEGFLRTQDYELNHRVIESGGIVWFTPAMKAAYRPRSSLRELARQYYRYGQAKRLFGRRHPGSLRWRQLAAPLLVVVVAASLIGAVWWSWTLAVPIAYALAMVVAGLLSRHPSLRTGYVLMTMHLSWGAGFLLGRGAS